MRHPDIVIEDDWSSEQAISVEIEWPIDRAAEDGSCANDQNIIIKDDWASRQISRIDVEWASGQSDAIDDGSACLQHIVIKEAGACDIEPAPSTAFAARLLRAAVPQPASHRGRLTYALAGHPARLLLLSWAVFFVLYYCGPLIYDHPVTSLTWMFVAVCTALFALGAWTTTSHDPHACADPISNARSLAADVIVQRTGLLAVAGGLATVLDKLILSGLDYSYGITALRFAQDEQVIFEGLTDHRRSPLLYFGYATVGFGAVSYAAYILRGELLARRSVWLAHAALLAPAAYSVLYGGRSPFALVLGLAGGAALVRRLGNRSWLPRDGVCRPVLLILFLVYSAYSNVIFIERRAYQRTLTLEAQAARYEEQLDARVRPGFVALAQQARFDEENLTSLMSLFFFYVPAGSMIDACKTCFTLTGSVGLQAAIAGRCPIVAASAYYAVPDRFIVLDGVDDVERLPALIEAFAPATPDQARAVARRLLRACVPGALPWRRFSATNPDHVERAAALVTSLDRYLPAFCAASRTGDRPHDGRLMWRGTPTRAVT